jgi:hypothetical protein
MDKTQEVGFVAACKDFFGMGNCLALSDFMKECAKLTPKDKQEIRDELIAKHGYQIKPL